MEEDNYRMYLIIQYRHLLSIALVVKQVEAICNFKWNKIDLDFHANPTLVVVEI